MRRSTRFFLIAVIAIALGIVFGGAGIWSEYMWFASLGYQGVFCTLFFTRYGVGLAVFALALLFFLVNFWFARRCLPQQQVRSVRNRVIELGESFARRFLFSRAGTWLGLGVSVLLALLLAGRAASQWELVQKFLHASPFGAADPVFGLDVGFYVFKLPFYELLRSLLSAALLLVFLLAGLAYLVLASGDFLRGGWRVFSPVKLHLGLLAAGLLVVKAWDYRLRAYELLLSPGGAFFGAGYTDLHARLPAFKILTVLSLLAALAVFVGILRGRLRPILVSTGILIAAVLLLEGGYPVLVQKFRVEPNEFSREQPYLEHHIAATRSAYGLDRVRREVFAPAASAPDARGPGQEVLAAYQDAIKNLRLWDYRPLGQVYNQLQQLRRYYRFQDVDVDRYTIGGNYRQVMLAVRELDQRSLPERAQTWVNRRLQYTHGYGLVMSPVNEAGPRGLPVFLLQDIPPQAKAAEIKVTRPEIYFGELTGNVVVVNTRADEFDYPSGQENVYTRYRGKGGVQLSNAWRRLLYAVRFRDLRLLLTTDLTPESRILYNRTVWDARRLAPYLMYDRDPYPVLAGGRIYWIWDACTVTNRYPYAEPHGRLNYIRNSVKVVVDAYHGEIAFYVSDPADPLIRTYKKIFPALYRPLEEMPQDLRAHLRYPVDLFQVQSSIYAVYHVSDARVFYNREDEWAIPSEKHTAASQKMEPYYAIVRLPGETQAEFVLALPLTPAKRENLIAWMAARCDGGHYGELVVYEFPKDVHVYGPMQVEASIDQDPDISQQLTLWSQRGSEVIRGNLITVPIAGKLLYVEPLFLQAEESSLPELARVITFYDGRLVMDKDLQGALNRLFASQEPAPPAAPESGAPAPPADLARRALELYREALARQRAGDWAGYGRALEELGEALEQMNEGARGARSA